MIACKSQLGVGIVPDLNEIVYGLSFSIFMIDFDFFLFLFLSKVKCKLFGVKLEFIVLQFICPCYDLCYKICLLANIFCSMKS